MTYKKIQEYCIKCNSLASFHNQQGINANNWYQITNLLSVVIIASQGLVMTVQTVKNIDAIAIGITGACFAFLSAIVGKIQSSYTFNALALQHNTLSDDYSELAYQFALLEEDAESVDEHKYEQHVMKLVYIGEREHLHTTRQCIFFKCCLP